MASRRSGSVTGVLLAAGLSTRFSDDRAKQLVDWFGRPLVVHATTVLRASKVDRVLVVLGHQADMVGDEVARAMSPVDRTPADRTTVDTVLNPLYERGRGTSIRSAIKRLETAAALFMPCDQPFVDPSIVDRLIDRYRATGVEAVAPHYGTDRGSPVLFDRSVFPALGELGDDEGGRRLLDQLQVERLEIDDPWVGFDIDTTNDLERARAEQERRNTISEAEPGR